MNNKVLLLSLVVVVLTVFGVFGWRFYGSRGQNAQSEESSNSTSASAFDKTPEPSDFTATFEIYTLGAKRVFTNAMYHNKSQEVFIENPDPSIIIVKKAGITWADFFKTLPFTLTKECLVTGTKETFCNSEVQKLRFVLNGIETADALDLKIQPGDALRVTFGN